MVRDRQHGPVIELNRMAIHRKATASSTQGNGKEIAGELIKYLTQLGIYFHASCNFFI